MANIVENSIVNLYNNYLDMVDGSNEALLETWLERINLSEVMIQPNGFLALSKSRGSLKSKIDKSTDWDTAQKHIKA